MIQDILPYNIDIQYKDTTPNAESYLVFIKEQTILLKIKEQTLTFPQFGQLLDQELETTYLFSVSGHSFFLAETYNISGMPGYSPPATVFLKDEYQFYDISILQKYSPKWMCFAGATAYQLGRWYNNNRYCGKCGKLLHNRLHERALCCENCNHIVYPKIQPAVIVAITNHDRILLTKYADTGHSENFALIAGFAEIGETIEETVHREVMEEVGIKVKNIRYYKSQPWAFSDTLLLGFFCELDGSDNILIDNHELSEAMWIDRENMDTKDDGISLTYEMMMCFKKNIIS